MKISTAVALVVAALCLVPAALAGGRPSPAPQDGWAGAHDDAIVVKRLSAAEARRLGVPENVLPGTTERTRIGALPAASCGACINTCWQITTRTGDDTLTGSYWEYDSPRWCGNGAVVTYRDASNHHQYVSGWYSANGESGPYWDGGCLNSCPSVHFTLYGTFTWHPPTLQSSKTLRLGVWLQAYGSAAYG